MKFICIIFLLSTSLINAAINLPLKVYTRDEKLRQLLKLTVPTDTKIDNMVAYNYMNLQYYTQITVGSNNQTMNVMLDTGSSWLWLASSDLTSEQFGTHRFNCMTSETCNLTATPLNITYSASEISGILGYDTVNLGNGFIVNNQGFAYITVTRNETGIQADGFWGLTPQDPTMGTPTLMDNLQTQGIIKLRTFALFLSNNPNGTNNDSSFIIGGYDPKYMLDANFTVLPLLGTFNYWTLWLNGSSLGKINLNLTSNETIIDCGAAYIFYSANDWPNVLAAFKQINPTCHEGPKSLISCNCSSAQDTLKFPNLTFTLGSAINATISLPAPHYISRQNGMCTMLITSKVGSVTRLGMAFVRSFYMYFNIDNRTIGFARANQTFLP